MLWLGQFHFRLEVTTDLFFYFKQDLSLSLNDQRLPWFPLKCRRCVKEPKKLKHVLMAVEIPNQAESHWHNLFVTDTVTGLSSLILSLFKLRKLYMCPRGNLKVKQTVKHTNFHGFVDFALLIGRGSSMQGKVKCWKKNTCTYFYFLLEFYYLFRMNVFHIMWLFIYELMISFIFKTHFLHPQIVSSHATTAVARWSGWTAAGTEAQRRTTHVLSNMP